MTPPAWTQLAHARARPATPASDTYPGTESMRLCSCRSPSGNRRTSVPGGQAPGRSRRAPATVTLPSPFLCAGCAPSCPGRCCLRQRWGWGWGWGHMAEPSGHKGEELGRHVALGATTAHSFKFVTFLTDLAFSEARSSVYFKYLGLFHWTARTRWSRQSRRSPACSGLTGPGTARPLSLQMTIKTPSGSQVTGFAGGIRDRTAVA